jgi:HKD family nuclease
MKIVTNKGASVGGLAPGLIAQSEEVLIAVGYATKSGIDLIMPSVKALLKQGHSLRLYLGMIMTHGTTRSDLGALRELNELPGPMSEERVAVASPGVRFHGKFFLCSSPDTSVLVAGSSNLTGGGFTHNVEFNFWIESSNQTELIKETRAIFEELWLGGIPFSNAEPPVRKNFALLKKALKRKEIPPDEPPEEVERILPPAAPKVVQTETTPLSYDNIHWGGRRGRSREEAYLNIGRFAEMFPARKLLFQVKTDSGQEFRAKVIGSSHAGDPKPIHLTSSPSNKDLGKWLRERGARQGDQIRISKMSDGTYLFELLHQE